MEINTINDKTQPVSAKIINIMQIFWGASYYGMFGLIVIYLSQYLNYSETTTMMIVGALGAMGPILSALGGLFNDRIFGAKRGIFIGYALYTVAYFILAYSAFYKIQTLSILALAVISFARGLSNTAPRTLIAKSYIKPNPTMMESSYAFNYMLNNVGSFIARISFPLLLASISYWGTFAISGLLILVDVIILIIYKNKLSSCGTEPDFKPVSLNLKFMFIVGSLALIALIYLSFNYLDITKNVVYVLGVVAFSFFLFEMSKATRVDKKKMLVALILLLETLMFFVYYNLFYTAVIFYAVNTMEHNLFGLPFNPVSTAAFNPFWVALSSPIIAYIFLNLEKINIKFTIFSKFAFGMIFTVLGFFTLYFSTKFISMETQKIPALWFLAVHFFQAVGEVLISALGIAAIVRLTPKKSTGFVVGLQLVTLSVTSIIAAVLSKQIALPAKGSVINVLEVLPIYGDFFKSMGSIAIIGVVVVIVLIPINKAILKSAGESI